MCEPKFNRDSFFVVEQNNIFHVISEKYYYKTDPYYTILCHENNGDTIFPTCQSILDASVVPICLERSHMAGIPVCDWGISQGYVPLPSIIYGLNYFATTAHYSAVKDSETAKKVIKHITNNGRYPFCYQNISDITTIESAVSIFGNTIDTPYEISTMSRDIYNIFKIPLILLVFAQNEGHYFLSSLTSLKYSQLSPNERTLLSSYIRGEITI